LARPHGGGTESRPARELVCSSAPLSMLPGLAAGDDKNKKMLNESLLPPEEQGAPQVSECSRWCTLVITVTALSLGTSLQYGFATGVLNNLEAIVPQSLAAAGHPITIEHWAFINSSFSLGGLIGVYAVLPVLGILGRKRTVLVSNVFVVISSALMYYGESWPVLVLGRMSIGLVGGVVQMVCGTYMTELSPVAVRGSVGVCSQLGIVLGIALANFLTAPSLHLFGSVEQWRNVFFVPVGFAVLQCLILPFCPDSPSFIIKVEGPRATLRTLLTLHRQDSADRHLSGLEAQLVESKGEDMSMLDLLAAKHLRKQVVVGMVLKMAVQFSGIDAIFYYSTIMFRHANVSDPAYATLMLTLVNLAMTFVASARARFEHTHAHVTVGRSRADHALLVHVCVARSLAARYMARSLTTRARPNHASAVAVIDMAGRRALIMITWVGMCSGFFVIFVASTVVEAFDAYVLLMSNVQVVAMVVIIVSFAVGIGNVEGFIISEISPVYAKDTLNSLGVPINWTANLLVSSTFPILFANMGRYTYTLFVLSTFCFGLFTWYRVPETKGKTLEQVTAEFAKY
jgi:SP family facilitated glucose transporter-like MFS transporter 1